MTSGCASRTCYDASDVNMLVCPCSVLEAEMTTFIDYDDNQAAGFDWSTMYSVSPLLYPTIGTVVTMVVALLLTIIPSQSHTSALYILSPFRHVDWIFVVFAI